MRDEMQAFLDRLLSIKAGIELRVEEIAELHETAAASIEDVADGIADSLEDLANEIDSIHGELEDFADSYETVNDTEEESEEVGRPLYGTEALQSLSNRLAAIERYLGVKALDT